MNAETRVGTGPQRLAIDRDPSRMPAGVKAGLWSLLALLLAGALYLVAVRGDALLIDLSAIGAIFCL